MSLSIVIVNYKSAGLILDCLESIYAFDQKKIHEVIIVDNGSGDDSEQVICSRFPQVRWVQLDYNAGFARANNEGIRRSSGELVLLLNPDTINLDNAISICAGRLNSSEFVAAGVQLLNRDRSLQISGSYFMKGGLNHLMSVPETGRLLRWIGLRLKVKNTSLKNADTVTQVDWINGAFLMVKRSAIEGAGLLDEDFFLYSEEIEWCYRLGKVGKMCIYGDLHVVHLIGVTADQVFDSGNVGYQQLTDRKGFQLMLSGLVRIRKQFGIFWLLLHLAFFWLSIPLIFLVLLFRMLLQPDSVSVYWEIAVGFARNVFKSTAYIGRICRNKPYFYKVL
ncbi:MAG: glycosyltransferase family 2 protein [Chitinophagaceae bacterium]|nr:glycosyltransferase family 2 protein [Chitinophagaceae bacterium]